MTPAGSLSIPSRSLPSNAARRALLVTVVAAAATWPTWGPLAHTWSTTTDYSHGPLVLLITLAWLVHAARTIDDVDIAGNWKRVAVLYGSLGLCLGAWLIAYKANVELGKQLLAPLIVWLAIACAAGRDAAVKLAAPIFYFYFASPVWELIVPLLQAITVAVTQLLLGAMGIPVRIDGVLVTIPEGSFIVQEGCSGKRYLIVALAMAFVLAPLLNMPRRKGLAYVALAGGLALLANWIRVIVVIYAGHATNMRHYFVAREHASLGWAIFIVLLGGVCAIGWRFRGPVRKPAPRAAPDTPTSATQGLTAQPALGSGLYRKQTAGLFGTLACLCIPPLAIGLRPAAAASELGLETSVRTRAPGWTGPTPPTGLWDPQFQGAATHTLDAFHAADGRWLEVYVATYPVQNVAAKLINYYNRIEGDH